MLVGLALHMATTTRIHAGKTPIRIHYIKEWADKFEVTPAEITQKTGADKSLISRWFKGTVPGERYLVQLKDIFGLEEVSSLFRDPEDDWIARWFRNRRSDHMQQVLRLMVELDSASSAKRG